jgi:hypothetical protein
MRELSLVDKEACCAEFILRAALDQSFTPETAAIFNAR